MGYPSLLRRFVATYVDFFFVLFLLYLYAHSSLYETDAGAWPMLAFILYEPVCTRWGCTLGQFSMHLRVRMVNDYSKVPVLRGLLRVCAKYLLGWHSFLKMPRHPQRRAFHDLLTGTVVLGVPQLAAHGPSNNRWRGP